MLGTIIDLFTSGGVGSIFAGITGLVGGWIAKREQRKLLELNNGHELSMADIDLRRDTLAYDHALVMIDKQMDQAQVEGQITEDIRDADAFVESMAQQRKTTGWFDIIKSAVRPVLTGVLIWMAYDIYSRLDEMVGGLKGLEPGQITQLYIYVIHAIIYLTITAVAWWFASRGDKAVKTIKGMLAK